MALEDLIKIAKLGKKVQPEELATAMKVAGKTAKEIEWAQQGYRVVRVNGVKYKVDWWLNDNEATQVVWNRVYKPRHLGEQKITLPSELPKERIQEIEKEVQQVEKAPESKQSADILEFNKAREPKKIEPGIYLDEDSGTYYRVNKDGSFDNLGKVDTSNGESK